MTIRMILIGGLPGSGKTFFGTQIAGHSLLDKDVVTHHLTTELLKKLDLSPHDRESPEYVDKVRPLEYKTVMAIAVKNIETGHSATCSAPFIKEFYDKEWVRRTTVEAEQYGAKCHFVWMDADEETLHKRIVYRGEQRDKWKLNHWDTWYQSVPKSPPEIPGLIIIRNQNNVPAMQEQIMNFLSSLTSRDA